MGKVLISGASGTIGSALSKGLAREGYEVVQLTRREAAGPDQITWDPAQPLSPSIVSGADAVIHLAGESIVGRWTEAKKRRIIESRVQSTRNLAAAAAKATPKPLVFISASAIGYYGNRGDEILVESSGPGSDFPAEICQQWEAATKPAQEAGIRTVHLRISVVLSATGGALPKMMTPFKLGLGGRMGSGKQWWSWIHVDDLTAAIPHIMKSNLQGPVNAASPQPVTNADFTRALAAAVRRPAIFPMPAFMVKMIFGQMGEELWLASQRVKPAKLIESGFQFTHPELGEALASLLKRN